MRRMVVVLAAFALPVAFSDAVLAEHGPESRPLADRVAAKLHKEAAARFEKDRDLFRTVGHRRHRGHYRRHHPGFHGHRRGFSRYYGWGGPAWEYHSYHYRPPVYRHWYHHYHHPRRGFSYHGPGLHLRFGF